MSGQDPTKPDDKRPIHAMRGYHDSISLCGAKVEYYQVNPPFASMRPTKRFIPGKGSWEDATCINCIKASMTLTRQAMYRLIDRFQRKLDQKRRRIKTIQDARKLERDGPGRMSTPDVLDFLKSMPDDVEWILFGKPATNLQVRDAIFKGRIIGRMITEERVTFEEVAH